MKPLLSLLFSFAIAITSFAQNGVYIYGFMENAPAQTVAVDVLIFSDSSMTGATFFTEPSGNIPVQWVDLPEGEEILWVSAGFLDCDSTYHQQDWGASEFDNLIDIPIFLNYCQDTLIYGCTDPESLNYNPNALFDDGSCQYAAVCDENDIYVTINTLSWGHELSWNLITNGVSVANGGNYNSHSSAVSHHCVPDGCYILELHDAWGDGWNGSTFEVALNGNFIASGTLFQGSFGTVTFGINQEDCPAVIYGCTDPESVNYNPTATNDDGTCAYPIANDICADALPILPGITLVDNSNAVVNAGIWGECWGFGQGEGEQSSVWYSFTTPDYPASIHLEALYDGTNTLTDTQFGIFEECGGEMIYCDGNGGQGLMSALSFACGELALNSTYILMIDGWMGDAGTCLLEYSVDSTCANTIYGCTDPNSFNYNPNATIDDGSCEYDCDLNAVQIIINTQSWANEISWELYDADYNALDSGSVYGNYTESLSQTCLEDGCYTFFMYDTFGDGWNGSSFEIISGGETLASGTLSSGNYGFINFGINQEGCADIPPINGCTDPISLNYNPNATVDDGSCQYAIECDLNPIDVVIVAGSWAYEISWELLNSDNITVASDSGYVNNIGSVSQLCLADGCYTFLMYDTYGDGWNGSTFEIFMNGESLAFGALSSGYYGYVDFGINQEGCVYTPPVYGCTDPEALNYNPNATEDNGSCEYLIDCDLNAIQVVINTQSWAYLISWDLLNADNISVASGGGYNDNVESWSQWCLEDGCYTFLMYDTISDGWIGSAGYGWNGSTFKIMSAGEILASGTYDYGGNGYIEFGINQEGCIYVPSIYGCTDPESLTYNPNATEDDGSCQYEIECDLNAIQVVISAGPWAYEISWELLNSDSISVASGSGYNSNVDSLSQLCLADGCYSFFMYDTYGDGWNGSVFEIFMNGESLAFGALSNGYYGSIDFGINQEDCVYTPPVYGCTDPEAINYNPDATENDGSCVYPIDCDLNGVQIVIATQAWGSEISWQLLNADSIAVASGSGYNSEMEYLSQWCLADGCYAFEMFDAFGDGWNGGSFEIIAADGDTLASGTLAYGNYDAVTFGINQEGCGDTPPVYGCTDPEALNYNPNATDDNGLCEYPIDCDLNTVQIITQGWGSEASWNLFNADSITVASGTGYGNNTEYLSQWCLEDGCYSFKMFEAYGSGWNGYTFAIVLDGDTLASGTWSFGNSGSIDFGINQEGCVFIPPVYGCTDPEALNYNPDALIDDGSCEYSAECDLNEIIVILNTNGSTNEIAWYLRNADSFPVAWGSGGYGNNPEYFSQLCLEDGCYTFEMFEDFGDGWSGCSFWIVLGGDTLASGTFNFGNSGSIAFGINQEGCNGASTIYGCTDPEATNYNPDATEDDGSCVYEFGCSIDFLVIPDSTGEDIIWIIPSGNLLESLEVLWDFGDGTTSTELFPQHEYSGDGPFTLCVTASFESTDGSTCSITYCAVLSGDMVGGSGFVASDDGFSINVINNQTAVGIAEPKSFSDLSLWPNPANDQLNIKYYTSINSTQTISIMDITGKMLIQDEFGSGAGEFTKTIDVSNLSSGVYLLRLSAEDHVEAKRFVIAK